MEQGPLLEALRADLADLTALHGVSGSEHAVVARLRDLCAPLVSEVAIDHMGNLTATVEGPPGAPQVVVAAHSDEIGAVVAMVEPDGFLRLYPIGGIQSRLLEGRAVSVGGHPGVVGARSGHLTSEAEQGRAAVIEELYVDLGVDDADAVHRLGVRVGDQVVVLSELRDLAGTRVSGKAIDNRAGCVVAVQLLRRLQGRALPCRLTVLIAVQEEVGWRGATAAFTRLHPDLAIVVDTVTAAGTPDTRHTTFAAHIGKGILIQPVGGDSAGFLLPRAAQDALIAAARRVGVPYQLAVSAHGVTDAAAAHIAAGGIATLQIQIPRRYSHSSVEVLDLRDLAAALTLTEELVFNPPTPDQLAFLKT